MKEHKLEADLQEEITLNGAMRITRIGRGHYICHSKSQKDVTYSVDLAAHSGLGHCSCKDFECRKYPVWKIEKKPLDSLRCVHIKRVRSHVLDALIHYFSDKEEKRGLCD